MGNEKGRVQELSIKIGFHLVKNVIQDHATHLIMTEASATPKAVQALSANVPIVNMRLFEDIFQLTTKPTKQRPLDPLSEAYQPPLADDAANMSGSHACFQKVDGRSHIFAKDVYFLEPSISSKLFI